LHFNLEAANCQLRNIKMSQAKKESIKIGIIGAGFARSTQIPAFRACEGARIVSIASGRRENAERVAREFDIKHVGADWREVVSREEVDLISIVTPPSTHVEMVLAALDAGKAVLCEKPMAMNADEADEMRRRAQETGALALIDHELRFVSGRRKMRELLRGGEIGRVRHAKLIFRADSRASNVRPWNWWSDKLAGGGVLGAIGSHAIDGLQWMLGAQVSSVFCQLATHVPERADALTGAMRRVTSDDEANLVLRFKDGELTQGATGTVSMSMTEAGRAEHCLELYGSEGALRLEGAFDLWYAGVGDGDWKQVETERGDLLATGLNDNEWARGFNVFSRLIIETLREGRREIADAATFDDGYRTQLVLDAARRSHEEGCWSNI
jgi:predicted dehydrogenase